MMRRSKQQSPLGILSAPRINHLEPSKAIIEFNGVPHLMRMLKASNIRAQIYGLTLLYYLTLHVGNSRLGPLSKYGHRMFSTPQHVPSCLSVRTLGRFLRKQFINSLSFKLEIRPLVVNDRLILQRRMCICMQRRLDKTKKLKALLVCAPA
ncbi:hypothetical protein CRG98_028726 [Punica granatum]|uniref:Uncharacterized protein n=1 Tax=Punica granatum TaxID=22663 RepID=A0A2I0J3U0_PUNGR|nr:hypothetical protein CRG98_028726 [Punica granatum]